MAANFKGPTRIYYDLVGRNHLYLPIPYLQMPGVRQLVVLGIEVDQNGNVQKAQVAERESTASDPCLVETAINTALLSRFNPDSNSPRIQLGTLYLSVCGAVKGATAQRRQRHSGMTNLNALAPRL